MIIGELITALLVCGAFLILKKFDTSVLFGAILGSAVTLANFLMLIISTNRAIDRAIAERGEGEMSEEEVAEFTARHQANLQAAARISYLVRTVCIAATLVVAFLLNGVFNVIATLVPLLMFRPIIVISQLLKNKISK